MSRTLLKLTLGPRPVLVGTPTGLKPISKDTSLPFMDHLQANNVPVNRSSNWADARIQGQGLRSGGYCEVTWIKRDIFSATMFRPNGFVRQNSDLAEDKYAIEVSRLLPPCFEGNNGIYFLPGLLLQGFFASALEFYRNLGGRRFDQVQAGLLEKFNPGRLLKAEDSIFINQDTLKRFDPDLFPGIYFSIKLHVSFNDATRQKALEFSLRQAGYNQDSPEIPTCMRHTISELIAEEELTLYAP